MNFAFDSTLNTYLVAIRSYEGISFYSGLTHLGASSIVALFVLIFLAFLWHRQWYRYAIALIHGLLGSTIMTQLLKVVVERPRPTLYPVFLEEGYSFPSGHATVATMLYGFCIVLVYRHVSHTSLRWVLIVLLLLLIVGISYSRLYLGVHYLSDVIAGMLVGGLWLFATKPKKLD